MLGALVELRQLEHLSPLMLAAEELRPLQRGQEEAVVLAGYFPRPVDQAAQADSLHHRSAALVVVHRVANGGRERLEVQRQPRRAEPVAAVRVGLAQEPRQVLEPPVEWADRLWFLESVLHPGQHSMAL